MEIGIYNDLSHQDYLEAEGISSSLLKELVFRSPAHAKAAMSGLRRKSSAAMTLGTIIHTAILEPHKFEAIYWVAPRKDDVPDALATVQDMREAAASHGVSLKGLTKKEDIKAALVASGAQVVFWDDLCEPPPGRQQITQDQYQAAMGAAEAVRSHPEAGPLLSNGSAEKSFFWKDQTGELCKARTDYLHPNGLIVDLKTCEDARLYAAQRAMHQYHYDLSAAHYMEAIRNSGMQVNGFAWVFVETTAPYAVQVYLASDSMIARARRKMREGLDYWSLCSIADSWPAYTIEAQEIDLPAYATGEYSE